jgi:SAM-dependent methyltransferase
VLERPKQLAKGFEVVRAPYRSFRAAVVGRKEPERVWEKGLSAEVDWWEEVLPSHVDWLEEWADPEAPMEDPRVTTLIDRIPKDTISLIDVGSGPLTALGKTYPGKTLNITATDPLAPEYVRIMREAGIEPPVAPIACRGEDLLERFRPGTFDIAFAQNALDHCADPVLVIMNMVHLVKKAGFVVLRHNRREARRTCYQGLHQWNFDVEHREFVIRRPRHDTVHVNRVLDGTATIACFVDEADYLEDDFLVCVITKLASGGPKSH